jgi:hypothetical protein
MIAMKAGRCSNEGCLKEKEKKKSQKSPRALIL